MPSLPFARSNRTPAQESLLTNEVEAIDFEVSVLERFLHAAPQMREESRYLIPPPDDFTMPTQTKTPNRAQLRKAQRQSLYYATKLVLMLAMLLFVSFWFVDRLLTVMR
jgi:hypothetical protein